MRDALVTSATDAHGASALATLDPALAHDAASTTVAQLIYPALFTTDSQMNVQNWGAQSLAISPDGLTLTIHLRSGMRFSDGEPVNAQTFAFALNRALDPCVNAPLASYLYVIVGAQAFNQEGCLDPLTDGVAGPTTTLIGAGQPINPVDPLTLTLTLTHPSISLLAALTTPIAYAVPPALVAQYGQFGWTAHLTDKGAFGGSLFQLDPKSPSGAVWLTRNTTFWGSSPRLRELEYTLTPNAGQAWTDYQAHKLDVGRLTAAAASSVTPKDAGVRSTPLLQLTSLGVNWHDAPFTDQSLRQALDLAINKQTLVPQSLAGLVIPTNHIIPQGIPGYNPSLVTPDLTQNLTGNLPQAVKLAAAFASSSCGGVFARCPSITLEVPAEDPTASVVAANIARMWQAAAPGYPLEVKIEPSAQLRQRVASGAAQLYLDQWTAPYPDAYASLSRFTSGGSGVAGSVSVPDATTLVTRAQADQDPAQAAKDDQAAEQLLVNAIAVIPLYQGELFYQVNPLAQNVAFDAEGRMSLYDTLPTVVMYQPASVGATT